MDIGQLPYKDMHSSGPTSRGGYMLTESSQLVRSKRWTTKNRFLCAFMSNILKVVSFMRDMFEMCLTGSILITTNL